MFCASLITFLQYLEHMEQGAPSVIYDWARNLYPSPVACCERFANTLFGFAFRIAYIFNMDPAAAFIPEQRKRRIIVLALGQTMVIFFPLDCVSASPCKPVNRNSKLDINFSCCDTTFSNCITPQSVGQCRSCT